MVSLFPALILAGCAPPAEQQAAAPPAFDSAAVTAAVADLWARWTVADSAGDVAAIADMVTDSVRLDVRGMPAIMGRAAWQAAAEGMYKMLKYDALSMSPEMTAAVSNELAYQFGSYRQGARDAKKHHTMDYSRYAATIRKDADGKWRLAYWMSFADSTIVIK
jgi:uncharacterized protein (TIGR02246 family)